MPISSTYSLTQHRVLFFALSMFFALSIRMVFTGPALGQDKAEQEAFFESHVRPVLIEHCVKCHGPSDQSGGLRLDRQVAVTKGGDSGQVIVAGVPEQSSLIRAVQYHDKDLQMPPDGKLRSEQIEILTTWVKSGGYWPADKTEVDQGIPPSRKIDLMRETHWAYRPIQAGRLPQTDAGNWVQQPLDRFVQAKLEAAGLRPNPVASRRDLIIRTHFTLIGLAPSFSEVEAFQNDRAHDAFERLVDRLLMSPHYGERWARHWLDLARFAETTGYQAGSRDTRYPYAYTYRDYVIRAFNEDFPFDQFIVDQLAADQLQLNDGEKHRLAAMGLLTVGRRFMGNPHDVIDDQIDVVTRAFLGISVACARCHDHKYDPVPSADYYSLYGVFASSQEPSELPLLGDPTTTPGYQDFLAAQADKQKEVDAWLEKKREETEHELRARVADYLVQVTKTPNPSEAKGARRTGQRTALRPRALGRWQEFLASVPQGDPVWGILGLFSSLPAEQFKEKSAALLCDAAALSQFNPQLIVALRAAPPESMVEVAQVVGQTISNAYLAWKDLKKKESAATRLANDHDEALRWLLYAPENPTSLTAEQMIALLDQGERNQYNQQLGKIKTIEITHSGAPPRGMVMVDKPSPYDPVIFRRGQPGNNGDVVPRRFLQVLASVDGGKPFTKGSGRLELARAIAHPNNPLTARVIVNRIWQHHFGSGLVTTASDFGSRGEVPSHPELLDYLAHQFVTSGWSIKRLHKSILMSATWQQASQRHELGESLDPENRLLWHMPRRRLEFEPLRDRLLDVAGTLDQSIGGRSVMIHEDAHRRGLYAYLDREDIPGLLASFDLPSPDASQAARSRTTVPQQSLFLINSKFVNQQAEALARRTQIVSSINERIQCLFRKSLVRDPDEQEINLAREFVERPPVKSTSQLDPWVQLSQVLILSNEFAFVD